MVRYKNRYIACEIEIKGEKLHQKIPFNPGQFSRSLLKTVQEIHGDFGVAAINQAFNVKYFNEKTLIAFIRTRHGPHRFVLSTIPLVKQVDKYNVSLKIVYVGATLKKCYEFLAKYQRTALWQFYHDLKTKKKNIKCVNKL